MKNLLKHSLSILLTLAVTLSVACLVATLSSRTASANPYISGSPGVLDVNGTSVVTPTTTMTNDYGVLPTDQLIEIRATNKNITLPSSGAGFANGHEYVIKVMSPLCTNTVVATAQLDGASTYVMTNQYATIHVRSDGTTWCFISKLSTP